MRALVALVLLATLVGCGRSDEEESAYYRGQRFAGTVMATVNIYSKGELLGECATEVRDNTTYEPQSDEANAFRDGCSDTWEESE